MNHTDHVRLIRDGIPTGSRVWGDFGSGRGAFTLALADILGEHGEIISVDQDRWALHQQKRTINGRFPHAKMTYIRQDYTKPLKNMPPLDGLVMANTLHFHQGERRLNLLRLIQGYLKVNGRLIVVEYDTNHGNRWVPHPMTFQSWQAIASEAGFSQTTLLTTHPSSFMGRFFSAVTVI
ncbi:MAG: class I SAM-dependent methyltransferase [Chloroflexota bacterium]